MPYTYEYTETLRQFGIVHIALKLIDTDNQLPEINVPVVLDESEYNEDNLNKITNEIINLHISENNKEIIDINTQTDLTLE
jgi:hypothetical protein